MQQSATRQEENCKKLQIFSERLKARRHKVGFSQETLAIKAGASPRSIANWESGDKETGNIPRGDKLHQLATALGVSVNWLLGGEDESSLAENAPAYQTAPDLRAEVLELRSRVTALEQRMEANFGEIAPERMAQIEQEFLAMLKRHLGPAAPGGAGYKESAALRPSKSKRTGEAPA